MDVQQHNGNGPFAVSGKSGLSLSAISGTLSPPLSIDSKRVGRPLSVSDPIEVEGDDSTDFDESPYGSPANNSPLHNNKGSSQSLISCNVKAFVDALRCAFSFAPTSNEETHNAIIENLIRTFQFSLPAWQPMVHFEDAHYTRNLLAFDENFSIMLLCWNKEQGTPIHEGPGGGERCWIKMLDGQLELSNYTSYCTTKNEAEVDQTKLLNEDFNSVVVFDDTIGPHKLRNPSTTKTAISLHIYSPPYIECCVKASGDRAITIPLVYKPVAGVKSQRPVRARSLSNMSPAMPKCAPVYTSLDSLVDMLRNELQKESSWDRTAETIDHMKGLLSTLRFNPKEYREYAHFTNGHYTRNLVGYDDKFTLLILCWEKGQASPIHDHASASCWVKILEGTMQETKYVTDEKTGDVTPVSVERLCSEEVTYIDDSRGIHKMENPSTKNVTMSLHVYSPPIKQCYCFDPQTGTKHQVTIGRANNTRNPFQERALTHDGQAELPTVKALVQRLSQVKEWEHSAITWLMNSVRFDEQEWAEYVHFSDFRYTRILIAFNEIFSLILICWNPGQGTPLHNHEGKGDNRKVWVRMLQGQLQHVQASSLDDPTPTSVDVFTTETGTVIQPDAHQIHKLENVSKEVAVSLHLYYPPYMECAWKGKGGETKSVPVVFCSKATSSPSMGLPRVGSKFRTFRKECIQYREKVFADFHSFVEALRPEFEKARPNCFCPKKITKLLETFQFHPQEWQQYVRFNANHYTRILVAQHKEFSLMLTCWDKAQTSPIHDHANSYAWVKVLQGTLRDVRYAIKGKEEEAEAEAEEQDKKEEKDEKDEKEEETRVPLERIDVNEYSIDSVICMDPSVIHAVSGVCTSGPTITLHLYCPPYVDCYCYTESGEKRRMNVKDIFMAGNKNSECPDESP